MDRTRTPPSPSAARYPATGIDPDELQAGAREPQGFEIYPHLQWHVKNRLAALKKEKGLN